MMDRAGQQLGNYRLIRLLGRGGFAEVYLGEHVRLKTLAAIKVMQTQLEGREEEEFLKEAQIIANLEHPNIVRILDFDFANGVPFLVMSYAPKGTLRDCYARGNSVPLPTIISYVKQIADALHYAHEEKVIHRDIKPENMLLGRRDEILLTDFGIATMAQSSRYQNTQNMAGTITYMSPEQIQGKPRPASDQYSLAVVVYEWLSGSRPFQGSFTEIATQHIFSAPPPLREKIPDVSPTIELVVMTALKKDSHERFASVKAFSVALEQASQETTLPVTASSASTQYPAAKISLAPSKATSNIPSVTPVNATQTPIPASSATPLPGTLLFTYLGHTQPIESIAWSPDSKYIASASDDGTVQVWEALTGKLIYWYRGHSQEVSAVVWSPNGDLIASAGEDQTVQVWEAMTGKLVQTYRGHSEGIWSLAWSPEGDSIASGGNDSSVHIWDVASGEIIFTCDNLAQSVLALAWSPADDYIAFQSDEVTIQLCDSVNGHIDYTYQGHTGQIWGIAWSPDGTCLASVGEDGTAQVWTPEGQTLFTYQGDQSPLLSAAWSPESTRIAAGGDNQTIQIWDIEGVKEILTYTGHSECVVTIAWSPNGAYIASGGEDKTIQVWVAPPISQ